MELLLIVGSYLSIGIGMGMCAFRSHIFHKKSWIRKDAWQNIGLSAFIWPWGIYELYKKEKSGKTK